MQYRNVLISGAGIAGPALAFWLRRHGAAPVVVERAPALREGGYKIDVRGAAVEVVRRMGLLDEVRRASTDLRGASLVDSAGRRLATMDADLFGGRIGDDVEIMRGDLAHILYAATRDTVEYRFDDAVAALEPCDTGVRVSFERGAPRVFDLVVGADGLHSRVRALAFGDEARFVRHLGHYVAIFIVASSLGLDRWELLYATPGKTVNVYRTRGQAEARAMFLFASPPLAYDRRDIDGQRQILATTFAGAGWEVPRLLEAMRAAPDFYFDAISQIVMDRWSRGRVALLGDAAYGPSPASGQGASLALVGAYILAGELAAGGDHHAAFSRYEAAMREFVARNQRLAPTNLKGMVLRSRSQIWLQTRMIRLLPHLPAGDRIIGRVAQAIHEAASAVTLKDYQACDVTTGGQPGATPSASAESQAAATAAITGAGGLDM